MTRDRKPSNSGVWLVFYVLFLAVATTAMIIFLELMVPNRTEETSFILSLAFAIPFAALGVIVANRVASLPRFNRDRGRS